MSNPKPYTELVPGTPEHLEFLTQAMITRNFYQLAALKNRTDKIIHVVHNWFYYTIIKIDNPEDVVVLYSPEGKATIKWLGNESIEEG